MAQAEGRLVGDAAPARGRAAAMQRRRQRVEGFLKTFEWTWTSAVVFSVGITAFLLIGMAVIPSFWLYYADQELGWDGAAPRTLFPWSWTQGVLPWTIPGFWLKELRDAVAMGLSTGPLITLLVGAAIMQNWRRKLRGATGDTRPTGGYR
jgi:hypothetical protein